MYLILVDFFVLTFKENRNLIFREIAVRWFWKILLDLVIAQLLWEINYLFVVKEKIKSYYTFICVLFL